MDQATVLLIDDEEALRGSLSQGLELTGQDVFASGRPESALERISRDFYGVLVTDIRMPGTDGFQVMKNAFEIDPALPVVLITGHGDVPLAVEAMRAGAYDFLEKPFSVAHLASVVERALDKRRLVLENRKLREELADRTGLESRLVGRTPAMDLLRKNVMALAATDADILILGETGSGKEVVARALHDEGPRKDKPFVALNCGALPAEIIESELFGHEKGTFTGASGQRIGKLEHAHGGTVFLDEIESMPLELQVKLLRVIETRTIERLGSNKAIELDVRFVAATKEDLEAAGKAGRFRLDLFYRLNVVNVEIPPLRDRIEDIPLLFRHLAVEARARYRREIPDIGELYLADLMARDWPGNVRELRNVADRFVLGLEQQSDPQSSNGSSLFEQIANYERALIAAELKRNGGVIKPTYENLGLSRKALYEKMRKHGLGKDEIDAV
ncbi:sigma-54-dependent transcriptional regulator [Roseibium album]|uniref:C4-dicarboxylate transport transcriptional regulatory protein DctD n=1 Tax=Roseibium album TaxID=311410 RepID=A0A0M6Z8P7_9HYPH|nr:sigma-54 dependent transcriptional regulator [Roseibium album]CTQ58787.1 C4-dicarboxylate transport transcriptional regulatory protein DctD [Roseibium album]CTQ67394.1 C4-dicarboxylate transport transcriptional regulatory protein DctD [Roseibium album]CTQ72639.1 C4-dicarboxylate transport transcriptional regulatory protein DctD [Roseibium album]